MKIINPASGYYNKYTTAKTAAGKADSAASAKNGGPAAAEKPTGITNTLELLASLGNDNQGKTTSVSSYARDIYQLGQSSLYATLSESQKNGIKEFLKDETDLSEVYVYSGENVEIDSETLAKAIEADPSLSKQATTNAASGRDLLEML